MQSIFNCVDSIKEWLEDICKNVKLKKPVDLKTGEFVLANPTVYSMFVPLNDFNEETQDYLCPLAVIEISNIDEYAFEHKGTIDIAIHIAVWNPGTSKDEKDDVEVSGMKTYKRDAEGWKDALVFSEAIINKLKSSISINGYRIVHKKGIQCRPYKENNAVVNFYPQYYIDVIFTIENYFSQTPSDSNYENFL